MESKTGIPTCRERLLFIHPQTFYSYRFASNRYSVPLGTYGVLPENQVVLDIQGEQQDKLIIRKQSNGEVLAEHQISSEKGKLIQNRNHTRDRSKGIEELKKSVISHFKEQEDASIYVDEICRTYVRYRRDQLTILLRVIKEETEWIDPALQKCIREKLYSANDFRDIVYYLKQSNLEEPAQLHEQQQVPMTPTNIQVETRPLETYTRILGGNVS
ncbi:hypothetical protein FITA111629_08705 [Filibacter tadaridae]